MPMDGLQCDANGITRFLSHELGEPELVSLERHLECCAACRAQLQNMAAGGRDWDQAGDFLKDQPFDLESLTWSGSQNSLAEELEATKCRALSLLAPTDDPQMLGRIGPYEVSALIGLGGMGAVFKGFDRSLNRFVAVKVLAAHLALTGSARSRFAREAQAAAAVIHDNVIAIHSVAEDCNPPYLVMPYIRGESLEQRLNNQGPLMVPEILRIAMQVAAGLAAAHAQGLVHRDIKPGNILLEDGVERVRITDFGLARAVDDASLTLSGMIAGTPQFMSPEQARGDAIDERSDLFSLGSLMYVMCTGRPPFRAETSFGTLRKITDAEPRSIRELRPDVPFWLGRIISKLMEKSPTERHQTAGHVEELLQRCLAHLQTPGKALPAELLAVEAKRAPPQRMTAVGIALVGLLGVSSVVLWDRSGPERGALPDPNASGRPVRGLDSNSAEAAGDTKPGRIGESHEDIRWHDGVSETLKQIRANAERLDRTVQSLDSGPDVLSAVDD